MLKFIKVSGKSLLPEYREGDFVLVAKIPFFLRHIRQGDIVVFAKFAVQLEAVRRHVLL